MFRKLSDLFNAALQPTRAALDWAQWQLQWERMKDKLPAGDGHPVLFLPGFLGHDTAMRVLRECAEDKGYKTYGWENGTNMGFDDETARHLRRRLQQIYRENKCKVTIVGHSLGGVYARELAREFPGMVRSVVTLGSPFGMMGDLKNATSEVVRSIYHFFNPQKSPLDDADFADRCLTPPPVPTTSIYSRADGVINWRACLNPKDKLAENILVDGSHTGMVFNPMAIAAVLDRLSQPEKGWKPMDRRHYRKLFPKMDKTSPRHPHCVKIRKPMFGNKPHP